MNKLYILVFALACSISLFSQENEIQVSKTIFESLRVPDKKTGASVFMIQDTRIDSLFAARSLSDAYATFAGYRVQVFSSNIQRTAKSEAYKIEKELKAAFPGYSVYVNYKAPYWKVRIGDFSTRQQAQNLRNDIVKKIPSLRDYSYAVSDQVNY